TDNHNNQIHIGSKYDNYEGMRAVIGGSDNHLLFITYRFNNISVFDLNTFQFIDRVILPTVDYVEYHCFVSKLANGQENKNKIHEMLLFCFEIGLLIEYDEDNNTFEFHDITVCCDIPFHYAYVCINDIILFFGGRDHANVLKLVHKYSIRENKWIKFQNVLPSPLLHCAAIFSEESNDIHIIGGQNSKDILSTHIKIKALECDISLL
ncbi:hypothetical protein RFI_39002, partial [Reticulomyxa filosa]